MNEFDRRWQTCAARARESAIAAVEAPPGLATRAWAQFTAQSEAAAAGVWPVLSFRALVLATLVLVVCLATEFFTAAPASAFAPHLEDVVTSVWGMP